MTLHHFITPDHLISLLETRSFHLVRQDCQKSDPSDGQLPASCFTEPHAGAIEKALCLEKEFLISQAWAVASLRSRTFIMSWTRAPSPKLVEIYGECGKRCELQCDENYLMGMIGYEVGGGMMFPPREQPLEEIPGATAAAELKETFYTKGEEAISVVPSAFATTHKHERFLDDAETRIEAIVLQRDLVLKPEDRVVKWRVTGFKGLRIRLAALMTDSQRIKIEALAASHNIPIVD